MVEITEQPIDVANVLRSVEKDTAGALVHFIGTVRREHGIKGLFYECYAEMAKPLMKQIELEARKQWSLEEISIVHRIGWVEVGEASVVVAVSSAHRREGFEACRYLIDRIKEEVPIWKKEFCQKEGKFEYVKNC